MTNAEIWLRKRLLFSWLTDLVVQNIMRLGHWMPDGETMLICRSRATDSRDGKWQAVRLMIQRDTDGIFKAIPEAGMNDQ